MNETLKMLREVGAMLDWNFECAKKCYEYESRMTDQKTKLLLHQMAQLHIKHYLELARQIQ